MKKSVLSWLVVSFAVVALAAVFAQGQSAGQPQAAGQASVGARAVSWPKSRSRNPPRDRPMSGCGFAVQNR